MDINLFSKCLKETVLESDCVCIPGLGTFFAQLEGASFSDRGAVLNPPYRKLSFRAEEQGDTTAFIKRLAAMLPAGSDVDAELDGLVEKMKDSIFGKRSIRLEGLGTLRPNSQQVVFFVADEGLDIYPEGFGLKPVEMKIHSEEAPAEIIAAEPEYSDDAQPEAHTAPEAEPGALAAAEQPAEAPLQTEAAQAAEKPARRKRHILGKTLLVLLVLCILAAVAVILFKDTPWMDALLDRILYTEEELRLIQMF